jgi:O-antigen ligase
MAIAFGFWLYLRTRVISPKWRALAMLTLVAGLVAPSARGPWLGAMTILIVFLALGPNRVNRIMKTVVPLAVAGMAALASPFGDKIVDRLPYIGTLDAGAISYREELAATSWQIIKQNPWFGTPGFLDQMESLRQGQGIIDLVNAYAGIGLAYGLVDLACFFGLFVFIAVQCMRGIRSLRSSDPDLSLMGASLVACIAGALLMLATVNLYLSVSYLTWALAGLALGYAGIAKKYAGSVADARVRPASPLTDGDFAPAGTK